MIIAPERKVYGKIKVINENRSDTETWLLEKKKRKNLVNLGYNNYVNNQKSKVKYENKRDIETWLLKKNLGWLLSE